MDGEMVKLRGAGRRDLRRDVRGLDCWA